MRFESIIVPAGFGWLAGMRSLAGPTFASYQLRRQSRFLPRGRVARVLSTRRAPLVLSALALGEAAVDKSARAPDRTWPPVLLGRAALGAAAGAGIADILRMSGKLAATLGAVAAIASSFAHLWLRRHGARAIHLSEQKLGFVEDALALGLGTAMARA